MYWLIALAFLVYYWSYLGYLVDGQARLQMPNLIYHTLALLGDACRGYKTRRAWRQLRVLWYWWLTNQSPSLFVNHGDYGEPLGENEVVLSIGLEDL